MFGIFGGKATESKKESKSDKEVKQLQSINRVHRTLSELATNQEKLMKSIEHLNKSRKQQTEQINKLAHDFYARARTEPLERSDTEEDRIRNNASSDEESDSEPSAPPRDTLNNTSEETGPQASSSQAHTTNLDSSQTTTNHVLLFDPLSGLSFPTYDHTCTSPDAFIHEVQEFLTLKQIPKSKWHMLVGRMLPAGSDILTWWKAKRISFRTWNDFRREFCHYESTESTHDLQLEKLYKRKQKYSEAFETYAWEIYKHFRKISATVSNETIIERIINSCIPELSVSLSQIKFHTVDEVISAGRVLIRNLNRIRTIEKKPLFRARQSDPMPFFSERKFTPHFTNAPENPPSPDSPVHQNAKPRYTPNPAHLKNSSSFPANKQTIPAHQPQRSSRFCTFCKRPGHLFETCYARETVTYMNMNSFQNSRNPFPQWQSNHNSQQNNSPLQPQNSPRPSSTLSSPPKITGNESWNEEGRSHISFLR